MNKRPLDELFIRNTLFYYDLSQDRINDFIEYNKANPEIWHLFRFTAYKAFDRKQRFSADAIFQIIRWERYSQDGPDGFKVNNNYRAIYPRLLATLDPQFEDFFSFRKVSPDIKKAVFDRDEEKVYSLP